MYHEIIQRRRDENPFIRNTDLAYDVILEDIIEGALKPGERVSQDTYAQHLGMSRTPVRDALLRLTEERFINSDERRGFTVCPIYYSDYAELSKFRQCLECTAAEIAVRIFEQKDIEHLWKNIEEMQTLTLRKGIEENAMKLTQLDMEFHRLIVEGSQNQYLIDAHARIRPRYYFYQRIVRKHSFNLFYTLDTHFQIYEAFKTHQESLVVELTRQHCEFYNKKKIQVIFEQSHST